MIYVTGRAAIIMKTLLIAAVCGWFWLPAPLQAAPKDSAPDPLFADDAPLEITLRGPFLEIDEERDKAAVYPAGTLNYSDGERTISIDTRFQPRGNFRLEKENCQHAQLWLQFKKKQVRETVFANQKRLKLVVQCKNSQRYQGYLRKEFQAYRMLNRLTDRSYRVRWAEVTYQTLEGDTLRTQPAFFVEHKNRLADRLALEAVSVERIRKDKLEPEQATMASLFNYMIGNADFSLITSKEGNCCHNAKLLQGADGSYIPVIYDFDSSGYVNAPYAETPPDLNLRSVRQRIYRGFCTEPEVLETALGEFRLHREALLELANETLYESKWMARSAVKYIDSFYTVIDNPKQLSRQITEVCR